LDISNGIHPLDWDFTWIEAREISRRVKAIFI